MLTPTVGLTENCDVVLFQRGWFMRKSVLTAAIFVAGITANSAAGAATLNLSVTADNAFSIYLSSNDAILGTPIGTSVGGPAGQWAQSFNYAATLSDPNYFIHVVGTNYNSANGLFDGAGTTNGSAPNPNAFLGQFSITGGGYVFANNTTSLLTNSDPNQWFGIGAANNTTWTQPSAAVQNFGQNGGNNIWGDAIGGPVPGISNQAFWIWSNPDNANYADLSTAIFSTEAPVVTPLPAALPLFAGGLGVLGLLARRRNRNSAAIATPERSPL